MYEKNKKTKLLVYESPKIHEVNITKNSQNLRDPRHESNSACGSSCWAYKKFFY